MVVSRPVGPAAACGTLLQISSLRASFVSFKLSVMRGKSRRSFSLSTSFAPRPPTGRTSAVEDAPVIDPWHAARCKALLLPVQAAVDHPLQDDGPFGLELLAQIGIALRG